MRRADSSSRFLRARKFQLEPAFKQLQDTETWRKQNAIEELYDSIDIDEYEETRRLVGACGRTTADNLRSIPNG